MSHQSFPARISHLLPAEWRTAFDEPLGTDPALPEDGLRHNMPLHSPAGAPRTLIGWCSAPEPDSCLVRMKFRRDAYGRPIDVPQVGNELPNRAPSAPPLVWRGRVRRGRDGRRQGGEARGSPFCP